jgi:hypothetical protein
MLGERLLQKLESAEIDRLYTELAKRIAPGTVLNAHSVLASCLATAFRQRKLSRDPMRDVDGDAAERVPCPPLARLRR